MPNVLLSQDGAVATVTVNRPDKLNALNAATLDELDSAFREIEAAESARAVIVTGAGEKAFVAGADINELAQLTSIRAKATARRGQRLFRRIELFPKPVVAAVNGFALGGGCELAMACHVRIASENAQFGLPEVGLGVIPGYGGTQRLARLVGRGRAIELTLTGQRIPAQEAWRIGLVNRVVPLEKLIEETGKLVGAMLRNAPVALAAALESIHLGLDMAMEQGMVLEANSFGVVSATEDMREGMQAFLDKRKPEFKNR
ncbi:MAG: enoyl-CoA hydratase/isomerase family protein [Candidatus Latescibacterota bacterium]|nr:MAG: enoyl-CoA hydratase/isomerase family protein [Candidatus Latescibacterota bacterium]